MSGPPELALYHVQPLADTQAAEVQALLAPVLKIVRATPRPIEFRPTGLWGGWSAGSRTSNPDGRVSLSEKLLSSSSRVRLVELYLHELAHVLLDDAEARIEGREFFVHAHNPAFASMQLVLLMRLDNASFKLDNPSSWTTSTSLYDLQDAPPVSWLAEQPAHVWQPRALAWALEQAAELATTDQNAEEVALEICQRYWKWADQLIAEPAQRAAAQHLVRQQELLRAQKDSKLRADLQLFRWLTCGFAAGLGSLAWLVLNMSR